MFNPEEDGVTHINIYSAGRTKLGQFLSNFAHTPVILDEGTFESIEGYWYWLSCHNDQLKKLYGFKAKQFGKQCNRNIKLNEEEFKKKIRIAINKKLNSYPEYKQMLKDSILPFKHYYVFNGITKDAGYEWIVKHIENVRTYLQNK